LTAIASQEHQEPKQPPMNADKRQYIDRTPCLVAVQDRRGSGVICGSMSALILQAIPGAFTGNGKADR
jgi:hypothetical protein